MNKTLISLLLALGYPAHAEENILDAEAAIKNGAPLAAYQHLAPHPLYPYLEARAYRDNLATTPTATPSAPRSPNRPTPTGRQAAKTTPSSQATAPATRTNPSNANTAWRS